MGAELRDYRKQPVEIGDVVLDARGYLYRITDLAGTEAAGTALGVRLRERLGARGRDLHSRKGASPEALRVNHMFKLSPDARPGYKGKHLYDQTFSTDVQPRLRQEISQRRAVVEDLSPRGSPTGRIDPKPAHAPFHDLPRGKLK